MTPVIFVSCEVHAVMALPATTKKVVAIWRATKSDRGAGDYSPYRRTPAMFGGDADALATGAMSAWRNPRRRSAFSLPSVQFDRRRS
ncbi:hypothetical protein [Lysobacter sp. Root690]|uniref:hypothetical protein n=1 Tax=Lysobacter sp. Root690 TaxID=1736588 RepID=UPI0006FA94FB|nr:hypothetical protein [Lysobacter sp. Root690]KRB06755.1 hypothetical protein ASD86_12120 [Lysobacter sp. Root690]